MTRPAGAGLSPLEVATGLALGRAEPAPGRPDTATPLVALERAMLPALERPPCLVSFSGGRDSSAVLAAATRLARREGLPPPIPATNRFRRAPASVEAEWQERVVSFLRLDDWHVAVHDDELDAVGPVATSVLRRHGLLWPFNVHFHVPLLVAAAGGSLLTGIGGDEVFAGSRWQRASDVLAGRARPVPRDVPRVALALAPTVVRRTWLHRRGVTPLPWLTPTGQSAFTRDWSAQAATEPRRHDVRVRWWRGLRSTRIGLACLDLVAADAGVEIGHPLADPAFGASLARTLAGPPARAEGLRLVFGSLLPDDVYRRRTKALFDEAFWGEPARELAAGWQGEGADAALVDAEALRQTWSKSVPDAHSLTLLQSAWLAGEHGRTAGIRTPSVAAGRPDTQPAA